MLPALEAREDDVDDVKWALHTAQARWQAGGQADALLWLRRAADAALEAGVHSRAAELRDDADELAEQVWEKPATEDEAKKPPAQANGRRLAPPPVRHSTPPDRVSGVDIEFELDAAPATDPDASAPPDSYVAAESIAEPEIAASPESLDADAIAELEAEELTEYIDDEVELIEDDEIAEVASQPAAELVAPSSRFSEPEVPRQSFAELDPHARSSVPELEVEELNAADLESLLGEAARLEDNSSADPDPASGGFEEAPKSLGTFSDRLSAVDVEPLSAESAIARLDSDPSSLSLQVPEHLEPKVATEVVGSEFEVESETSEPEVDGIALGDARGFEDLPQEVKLALSKSARIETLGRGEEVGFFGAALITRGAVDILPAFADDAGAQARQGDVVFTKGSLSESIELRVEAKIDDTRVAIWTPEEIERILEACPWVSDELRFTADYYLAVCGATLGPMGERLDNALRTTIFSKMEVRAIEPGGIVATGGKPLDGLYIVGGGRIELMAGGAVESELSPGDFLFPSTMLSGQSAPQDARAGSGGALILTTPRATARELMMSVPPLLEVLAS